MEIVIQYESTDKLRRLLILKRIKVFPPLVVEVNDNISNEAREFITKAIQSFSIEFLAYHFLVIEPLMIKVSPEIAISSPLFRKMKQQVRLAEKVKEFMLEKSKRERLLNKIKQIPRTELIESFRAGMTTETVDTILDIMGFDTLTAREFNKFTVRKKKEPSTQDVKSFLGGSDES